MTVPDSSYGKLAVEASGLIKTFGGPRGRRHRSARALRPGVTGQYASVDENLTARENVVLQAFVRVNPVSLVIDTVRDLINDGLLTGNAVWALVECAAVVAIFAPLAVRSYSRKM